MVNKILNGLKIIIAILVLIVIIDFIPKKKKLVFIPKNTSVKKIAKILKGENIILSENFFKILTLLSFSSKKIKYGNYELYFSFTTLPVLYRLVRGPEVVKITIPEGFTVEQIAERLFVNKVILDPIEFITYVKSNNLEGFLFPETYYFYKFDNVKNIVERMVKEFYKNYNLDFTKRAYEIKFTTYQVVILASIIEKEAKTPEEKQLISAVFHNRLKKGWNLESCATVRYALKKFKDRLTYKDLEVDSKFNTYKYYGLPPHPICNPGLDSIKAALYPKETDAMFFFTKDNNTHIFSKYYTQHLNRQKGKN
ncbi:MAG: endolytic transglycosylase MltG [Elusimicrobiota bacterium]|nr:endolytic transglycosylase MltG [Endomicrobiia bacterium]MDW8165727.1 endolytic transglycosylase MltG [Elusimicrobiota bacterium]